MILPTRLFLFLSLFFLFETSCYGQFLLPSPDCNGSFLSDYFELEDGRAEDCNRDGQPDICNLQSTGYQFRGTTRPQQAIKEGAVTAGEARLEDFDGDGSLDIAAIVAEGSFAGPQEPYELRIFLADDNGLLVDSAGFVIEGSSPRELDAIQGLNGMDLISGTQYFENDGSGVFTETSIDRVDGDIVARGDVNGDGLDDLLILRSIRDSATATYSLDIRVAKGGGVFSAAQVLVENENFRIAPLVIDIDGDNKAEIVVAIPVDDSSDILFFDSDSLGDVSQYSKASIPKLATSSIQIADIDNSGKLDLILGVGRKTYSVLDPNFDASEFTPRLAGDTPCGIGKLIDIDADGDLDFYCNSARRFSSCCISFYRNYILNDGAGYFFLASQEETYGSQTLIPTYPLDEKLVDVSGDGLPDSVSVFVSGALTSQSLYLRSLEQAVSSISSAPETDANRNLVPDSCEVDGLSVRRYSLWNSFADLTNILELANLNDETVRLRVALRDSGGEIVNSVDLQLAPKEQRDLILNEFSALTVPAYGVVEVISTAGVSGAVTYYRSTPASSRLRAGFDTGDFDFAFQIPLTAPSYTAKPFLFNSMQPSFRMADGSVPVFNWLTLVNLAPSTKQFRVETRLEGESTSVSKVVELPEFGRIDLDGGHGGESRFTRGVHKVSAIEEGTPYIALLTRYGGTADPNRFAYAFPAFGVNPVSIVSTGGGAVTWLEVANDGDSEISVKARALDVGGNEIFLETLEFAPNENRHFLINDWIGNNATASLRLVKRSGEGDLHAQAVSYFYSPVNGSIETAYLNSSPSIAAPLRHFSYNLYLGMSNWLRVSNTDLQERNFQLSTIAPSDSGDPLSSLSITTPPSGIVELDIHNASRFGTSPNTYGLVELDFQLNYATPVDLIRVKPTESGRFDFIMETSLR
jgi:hypothetical protein